MNNDLISRRDLKEVINSSIEQATKVGILVDADYLWQLLNYAIDNAPTVEERPQGKGKWIKIEPETRGYAEFFRCSHCLYNIQLAYWDNECDYDYCPNCGARMEADNDSKRTY